MIPKLQTENLKAADAVITFLAENPGASQNDIRKVIDKNKKVLKNGYYGFSFDGKAHYKNYQNIELFLVGKNLVETKRDGKYLRYYLK